MKNIKSYKEYLNEGVRDLMKGKSEEELWNKFVKILKEVDNPLSEYPNQINQEFDKISEMFNVSKDDLQLITQEDENYGNINDFFIELSNGKEKVDVKVKETEDSYGGIWECYPELKISHWINDQFGEIEAWIFSKNDFKEKYIKPIYYKSGGEID